MVDIYASRRKRFLASLSEGCALICSAESKIRSADQFFTFRPDMNFYYLTGFEEPHAAAMFYAKGDAPFVMFVQPRDPKKEVWDGIRYGLEGAEKHFAANKAYEGADLEKHLAQAVRAQGVLHYGYGRSRVYDDMVHRIVSNYQPILRAGDKELRAIQNPHVLIEEARLIKDDHEIKRLQRAADIAAVGFKEIMKALPRLAHEYEVEALLESHYRRQGAFGPAFDSIVACGDRATILHYCTNREALDQQSLVLIDSGAEADYYNSDVTRTFPVSGTFSKEQKQVYEIVLKAQENAIAKVKPGMTWPELHEGVRKDMALGLKSIGLLSGNDDQLVDSEAFNSLFYHKTGHWLGLDVHDVGPYYNNDNTPRVFEPGMVLTIEPGLYLAQNNDHVPKAYKGIGIRIEDDVVVTKDGAQVLTSGIPKQVSEIEDIMNA